MTNPDTRLADELRQGGLALIAEAVADIANGRGLPDWWVDDLKRRVAAVPPGNVAQPAPTALDDLRKVKGATGANPPEITWQHRFEAERSAFNVARADYNDLAASYEAVAAERDALTARVRRLEAELDETRALEGQLSELDAVLNKTHDMVIEPLEAKLAEAERTLARLRLELSGQGLEASNGYDGDTDSSCGSSDSELQELTTECQKHRKAQDAIAEAFGMVHEPCQGPTWPANWAALIDKARALSALDKPAAAVAAEPREIRVRHCKHRHPLEMGPCPMCEYEPSDPDPTAETKET